MASAWSRTACIASSTSVLVIERIASRSSTSSRPIRSALLAGASDTESPLSGSPHLLRGERRRKGRSDGECCGDQLRLLLAVDGVRAGGGAARLVARHPHDPMGVLEALVEAALGEVPGAHVLGLLLQPPDPGRVGVAGDVSGHTEER